jgi:hypothetical protein
VHAPGRAETSARGAHCEAERVALAERRRRRRIMRRRKN